MDARNVLEAIPIRNNVFYGARAVFNSNYVFEVYFLVLFHDLFLRFGIVMQQNLEAPRLKKFSSEATASGTKAL